MTVHPNDPIHRDRDVGMRRDGGVMSWLLGALAVAALLGVVFWSMSGPSTVATNRGDVNTGTTTTRPAPAPAAPAAPATPARP